MLHSVTTQMAKLNAQMLPIVYRRGIEKIPDEILARVLVLAFDYDPDTSCMPYVTSLVDVLSQILLLGAFAAAHALGDKVHV